MTINTNAERPQIFVENPFKYMPASASYAKYNSTLLKSLNDFVLQVMAGSRKASDVNAYASDWKSAGGEEVRSELTAYLAK